MKKLLIPLGFMTICLIWGSTWLAIKWGFDAFPPLLGSAIRFLLAAAIYGVLAPYLKISLPRNSNEWKVVFTLGLVGFGLAYGIVYIGQQYIPSALASIMFTTYPFWVAIGSILILKETRFNGLKVLALLTGFTGIVLIFGRKITGFEWSYLTGMGLILLSSFMQAVNLITIKRWGTRLSPSELNFFSMAVGGLFLLLWSFFTEDWTQTTLSTRGLLATLYLTIMGSVIVFAVYWWLLARVQAVTLSLSAFITPLVAVAVGFFLGGEVLDVWVYAGGLMAISGILIYQFSEKGFSK